eukprot:362255-Chlamydomonas_euryale.AAC.5
MDGWMDGWTDGWTDGWNHRSWHEVVAKPGKRLGACPAAKYSCACILLPDTAVHSPCCRAHSSSTLLRDADRVPAPPPHITSSMPQPPAAASASAAAHTPLPSVPLRVRGCKRLDSASAKAGAR